MRKEFKPFPFQVHDQLTLAANDYVGLLAIEPGGMKTAAALLAHRNSGAEVTLVVAPQNSHRSAWIKDAEWILGVTPRRIGNGRKAEREAMLDFLTGMPGIYLITPQLLTRSDTSGWSGDLCIVDEGHLLNRPHSKGQKALQSLVEAFPMRLYLSGTPWRNNFERAWSVARFLWPEQNKRGQIAHSNQWVWSRDRMTSEKVFTGRDQFGNAKYATVWLNEKEPGRLLSEMPCAIVHKKREECCEFHTVERQGFAGFLNLEEPQIITREVPLSAEQKRIIRQLEEQYLAWLDDNPLVVDLPMVMKQRVRTVTLGVPEVEDYEVINEDGVSEVKQRLWFENDCKSPVTEEILEILEEQGDEPVVVYLESQSFASVLVHKLNMAGVSAFEYSGQTKDTREEDLRLFGSKYRVAVVVISAGGTGTDGIQHVTSTEIWAERSVDETNNLQAESRADRIGGKGQVQRFILVDDLGYAEGRFSKQMEKRLALNETLRRKQ